MQEHIKFTKQKDYKYIGELGQGGLGRTVLLLDTELDETFVCKKYSPYDPEIKEEYYKYFKNEIKVMYNVNNLNIVRIFTYYLYPENNTGYILMEYVEGKNIYEYLIENPSKIDYVFEQVIDAFKYLENIKILHRDIRIENILVSSEGIAKIIDFGFGKIIKNDSDHTKSISLNWWCDVPAEFQSGVYDHRTEIYFIGKLFGKILSDALEDFILIDFKYEFLLEKMVKHDPSERFQTFFQIQENMIESVTNYQKHYTYDEKETYKKFVTDLVDAIPEIDSKAKYKTDINKMIVQLENIYRSNALEDTIQNTVDITRVFLDGSYRYYAAPRFSCYNLREFIRMLKSSNKEKINIILLNIQNRLNIITRKEEKYIPNDDVPF